MIHGYSEAAYFDGYHVQHIADWEELRARSARDARNRRLVLARIRKTTGRI